MEVIFELQDLHTHFFTYDGIVKAVNGVSFSLHEGEMLGLVGETESGKTVLVQSMMNMVPWPGRVVAGRALYGGLDLIQLSEDKLYKIRGKDISLIVPNARTALDPLMRVGKQIANVMVEHLKISKKEAHDQAVALIEAVGIPDPASRARAYPHELSGGMAQRIAIAMALSCSPRLIIADEPSTGLDVTIQAQVLELLRDLLQAHGSTSLMVTRDLGIVAHYCERVAVLFAGQIVEMADVVSFFDGARHPYSTALLDAVCASRGEGQMTAAMGSTIDLLHLPAGCYFQTRCPLKLPTGLCEKVMPELEEVAPGHFVRCHAVEAGT